LASIAHIVAALPTVIFPRLDEGSPAVVIGFHLPLPGSNPIGVPSLATPKTSPPGAADRSRSTTLS
jgi:hypothetical protein